MRLIFFSLLVLLAACAPKSTRFRLPDDLLKTPARAVPFCHNWQGYVPDTARPEYLPMRYIRINFHIMNSRDSTHNYREDEARRFYKELLRLANEELDTNEVNWRSPRNTPALPKRYRYVLHPQPDRPGDDGFYFHYDDAMYYFVSMGANQNNYDTKVIEKYGIGLDTIVNMFVQVHPDDSCRSKFYRANGQGIGLGTNLKMAGIFESKHPPENFDGLVNHEVGHCLSLSHAWAEDGCPDTENHRNKCYVCEGPPPCDSICTNNMMDYNHYQIALTPCQIGRIQATFANEKSRIRRCLVPTWCTLDPARDLVIRDSVHWTGARDLEGNLTIAPGGRLRLSCRVSIPPGGKITVQPGGVLYLDGCKLHNACGKTWRGIHVQRKRGVAGDVQIVKTPVFENIE